MIGAVALAALIGAPDAPRGCADHWQVELDRESFAHNGAGRTFTGGELADFRTKIQAALRTAAADACRSKRLSSSRAAGIRRVQVFSASGASEPHFYSATKGTLNFEWVFAEEGLAVPPRATMAGGLMCWADPAEQACSDQGD